MLGMALLLLPGMPGGGDASDASRVAYIAAHPYLWRLGWLPWQVTAFSDVLLGIALLRTSMIPRVPAFLALFATLAAVSIEQPAEFRWITTGVALAQHANLAEYLRFESVILERTSAWAAAAYTVAALFWTWCFAAAGTWNRFLTWLSWAVWSLLLAVSVGPLLPEPVRPGAGLVAAGNAIGFILLMLWLCVVTELVLRKPRPDSSSGRMAPWRYPERNFSGRVLNALANSRLARAYGEWLPAVAYRSDITNVIYVNYLVTADRLEPLVPWGLELQRLGPGRAYAMFTFLTYRHGHFGPRLLGPLRRLMPSPLQSNWRIHVTNPQTGVAGIHFVSTATDNALVALLARLLSEGVPMHLVAHGAVTAAADGSFQVELDPRSGSAPDAAVRLQQAPDRPLPEPWNQCFESYHDMLAYCVPQDRALSSQPWYRRITSQEIHLGIPLDSCEPLAGTAVSNAAGALVGDADPLCFRVAGVHFRFDRETHHILTQVRMSSRLYES